MEEILHFIGGERVPAASGAFLDNLEPATGAVYSRVARGDGPDVERAVRAARKAFGAWCATPVEQRARLLLDVAARIERDLESFARAESVDSGKPLSLARTLDIPRAVANLRFFATAVLHFSSESHASDYRALNYTLRRPRGVAGVISPWNLPLYLLTWKAAPALAAGCTVVAKPSELTPKTAALFADACRDAGLPPGVLNIVHGTGPEAGAALVRHPEVPTLSFTGGTVTGGEIARQAGPRFKKLALELGGKNPTIVFADADLEEAVAASVRAAFSNQGQVCLAGSRVFVERPIYEAFAERFVALARGLRLGDPLDPRTEQGALISRAHLEQVLACLRQAETDGGRIRCGGGPPATLPERCRGGFFLEPTVVTDLPAACRTNREEVFGPLATLLPFADEAELLRQANDTAYGLAASIWTEDLSRAHRLAERIDCGVIWINCWLERDLRVPFGGMKHSGVGREGGVEALRFFTEPKNVCIRYRDAAPGDAPA